MCKHPLPHHPPTLGNIFISKREYFDWEWVSHHPNTISRHPLMWEKWRNSKTQNLMHLKANYISKFAGPMMLIWDVLMTHTKKWLLYVLLVGVSIYACRHSGRYLVAYEEGNALFDVVLSPLCDIVPNFKSSGLQLEMVSLVSDKQHVKKVARKIVWVHNFTACLCFMFTATITHCNICIQKSNNYSLFFA